MRDSGRSLKRRARECCQQNPWSKRGAVSRTNQELPYLFRTPYASEGRLLLNLKIGNFTSANRQTDFRRWVILLCSPKSKQILAGLNLSWTDRVSQRPR